MMRRRGRPLMRAAATTAVVAGTAGAVHHHQEQKYANQAAQQQAAVRGAAGGPGAGRAPGGVRPGSPAAAPAPAAPASTGIDMEQLKQLGDLHAAGVLTDEEFATAKAKLLGLTPFRDHHEAGREAGFVASGHPFGARVDLGPHHRANCPCRDRRLPHSPATAPGGPRPVQPSLCCA